MIPKHISEEYERIVTELLSFENIKLIINTPNRQYIEDATPMMGKWYIIQFGEKYGHQDLVYLIRHKLGPQYEAYFARMLVNKHRIGKGLSMSIGKLGTSTQYGLEEAYLFPIKYIGQNTFINWNTNPLSSRK